MNDRKYRLEDLKLGMVVSAEQLSEIYDTWIILTKPKNSNYKYGEGVVSFIGKEGNSESEKLYNGKNIIIPIFNDSTELNGICTMKNRKYRLEDLKLGMVVFAEQLSEIYDTWIMLVQPKGSNYGLTEGIVSFIGNEPTTESDKLFGHENVVIPVFNDSLEDEYDE